MIYTHVTVAPICFSLLTGILTFLHLKKLEDVLYLNIFSSLPLFFSCSWAECIGVAAFIIEVAE